MRVLVVLIFSFFLCTSCDFIKSYEDQTATQKTVIASVNNKKLFKEDIADLIPETISVEDSVLLVQSVVKDWALKELMLQKSAQNSSQENLENIAELVNKYRESLLINSYKESVIKQQLDTVVADEEIKNYYQTNERNFRLNETLIQLKYLKFSTTISDQKEIIKAFKSNAIEDVEYLQFQELSFKEIDLNDSIWRTTDNVLLKLPFSNDKLLKKSKYIQKEVALDLYLIAVKNRLERGDLAPISYISSTIKQLILHQRKLELVRDIEKTILKDATQNKIFKTY